MNQRHREIFQVYIYLATSAHIKYENSKTKFCLMELSLEKFFINFAPVGIYVMRYMKNCQSMSWAKKRNINKTIFYTILRVRRGGICYTICTHYKSFCPKTSLIVSFVLPSVEVQRMHYIYILLLHTLFEKYLFTIYTLYTIYSLFMCKCIRCFAHQKR